VVTVNLLVVECCCITSSAHLNFCGIFTATSDKLSNNVRKYGNAASCQTIDDNVM